jgi:hypothetical protein
MHALTSGFTYQSISESAYLEHRRAAHKSVSGMDVGHRQRFRNEVTSQTDSHKLRVPSDRAEVVGLLVIQARDDDVSPVLLEIDTPSVAAKVRGRS